MMKLKKSMIFVFFLFIYGFSYAQQNNEEIKIYGVFPLTDGNKSYRIQVGAFRNGANALVIFNLLSENGFSPVYEMYNDYLRVLLVGIRAYDIESIIDKLSKLNFRELFISEETDIDYLPRPDPDTAVPPPQIAIVPLPGSVSVPVPPWQQRIEKLTPEELIQEAEAALTLLKKILENNNDPEMTFEKYMAMENEYPYGFRDKLEMRRQYIYIYGGY